MIIENAIVALRPERLAANIAEWGISMELEGAYFTRRADEERTAAEHAGHPNARKAHLEMAERYQKMAFTFGGGRQRPSEKPSTDIGGLPLRS